MTKKQKAIILYREVLEYAKLKRILTVYTRK